MRKNFLEEGQIVIIAFLTLIILLILGSYFLTFTLTESKISQSQVVGTKIYYLAEAGINEAIWKLKNDDTTSDGDPAWKSDFIDPSKNPYPDGTYWSATFSKTNVLGGSYTATVQNTVRGRGKVTAIATTTFSGGKVAQRVVKTTVFRGLAGPTQDGAVFSGGTSENIDINSTYLRIYNGNLFSNHNLDIKGGSIVEVYDNPDTPSVLEGQVLVNGNILLKDSTLNNCEVKCAKNECVQCPNNIRNKKCKNCPPDSVSVPLIDFDSESSYSFKSRAQAAQNAGQCQVLCQKSGQSQYQCSNKCVFTVAEFDDLLWEVGQGGNLTLNNAVTYTTGSIELKGGRHLIINGALVADDNISIGESYFWTRQGKKQEGFSQITINQPTPTTPSGLLTKRKINFGLYSSFQDINIVGVIYANDETKLISVPKSFNVLGGIIARKLSFTSIWQWLNITLDNEKILYGLGYKIDSTPINPVYSPVIMVEHWEESY